MTTMPPRTRGGCDEMNRSSLELIHPALLALRQFLGAALRVLPVEPCLLAGLLLFLQLEGP